MSTKYIRVSSDLHLEQYYGMDVAAVEIDVLPKDERDIASILVLAGDISSKPDQLVQFIAQVEKRFRYVLYVPGNHEYYRNEITTWEPTVERMISDNSDKTSAAIGKIMCLQIDGIRFIFGTLWADGGATLHDQAMVGRYLNDFRIITLNGKKFTVSDMQVIHKQMKGDIERFLQQDTSGLKNIVITHHMPSYRLCHPRFGGDANGGFASNCDAILASDYAPAIWIHGHTHDTIDTQLYNTRIVCNPRGYHHEFRGDATHEFNSYKVEPKFIEL